MTLRLLPFSGASSALRNSPNMSLYVQEADMRRLTFVIAVGPDGGEKVGIGDFAVRLIDDRNDPECDLRVCLVL